MNKKAQAMSGMQAFILGIVAVAVMLAVGLIVLGELKQTVADDSPRQTTINETVRIINNTYVALAKPCFAHLTCSWVINHTHASNELLNTSMYDCKAGSGIRMQNRTGAAPGAGNGSVSKDVNVTYTCSDGDAQFNSTGTIITKLATVPTWIGIIITVALAFIVLGYFFSRRQ